MTKDKPTINPLVSTQFKKIFKREAVRASVTAQNWQEAVQIAGKLLVNTGSIKQSYVDAMEKVLLDLGPYAVIAPGIVPLHARPEDGVNEPCFGLITLATPVPFGHTQNDPVDLVFVLGATDKSSHIQALQRLAGLLSDASSLETLRASRDDEQLFTVIQSWDGNP
jgi:mannitol/fructose-specific phosphotransferase system IIA component (Ntr-type)